jgi:site-specific DNA-methyltransferase (adenine-specific)
MDKIPDGSVDTIITDPPYGLSFMGKKWDYDVPAVEIWTEALRVLKPGGTLLCFAGSRTQHRMAVNVEDAGFILKDCIMWLYGSGFPKATDISKQLDKGHKREVIGDNPNNRPNCAGKQTRSMAAPITVQPITAPATPEAILWNGWKSHGLKPAYEPILVAMKPNDGTYANNALMHGVSGLNIDGGRIGTGSDRVSGGNSGDGTFGATKGVDRPTGGRFPANVILDEEAGRMLDEQTGQLTSGAMNSTTKGHDPETFNCYGKQYVRQVKAAGDSGGASRFFYCAKASKKERNAGCDDIEEKEKRYRATANGTGETSKGSERFTSKMRNHHPTVKPIALMEYLCTLTKTPTGGTVLDPFMGSGTTGIACVNTGRGFIGIEMNPEYYEIAKKRIREAEDACGLFK